jgi:hypothetical protein
MYMENMHSLLTVIRVWLAVVVEFLDRYLYAGIACQHFCLFKTAGSNFKHVHVHILRSGPGSNNSGGYTGLGHDDETPGLSNPEDDKHNTVSRGGDCYFQPSPGDKKIALAPSDLNAYSPTTGYFYPAPAEGACAPGYMRIQCDCGDMCVTFNRAVYEAWRKTQ